MKIRVKVEGLKQVRDALASLPNGTQRNIMRRVLIARAQPMHDAAKRMAPVDTGFLARSIRIQTATGGAAGKAAFAAVMASGGGRAAAGAAARSANAAGKSQVEIYIGPNAGPREIAAEFGTKFQSAQPFMRPAFDSNKNGVLENLAKDMLEEIMKAVRRRDKRAAKLAAAAAIEG